MGYFFGKGLFTAHTGYFVGKLIKKESAVARPLDARFMSQSDITHNAVSIQPGSGGQLLIRFESGSLPPDRWGLCDCSANQNTACFGSHGIQEQSCLSGSSGSPQWVGCKESGGWVADPPLNSSTLQAQWTLPPRRPANRTC